VAINVARPQIPEAWKIHEQVTTKVVGEGKNMTAFMSIWEPHSAFATHTHPHEQIGICLQGEAILQKQLLMVIYRIYIESGRKNSPRCEPLVVSGRMFF
jgi:quercetin dioxygenase-like cupin family protein